jgi:hypothetical protein
MGPDYGQTNLYFDTGLQLVIFLPTFESMRTTRVKLTGRCEVFHCLTRVVAGGKILDDASKEVLAQGGQLSLPEVLL